jgi:hypothetical protein
LSSRGSRPWRWVHGMGLREGAFSRQKANLCVSAGSRKKSRKIQRANPRSAHISQSNCRHVGVSHAQCYVTHPEMHSALTAFCEEPTYRDLTKNAPSLPASSLLPNGATMQGSRRMVLFCACSFRFRIATYTSGKIMRPYHDFLRTITFGAHCAES